MSKELDSAHSGPPAAQWALSLGVVSLLCALVPVIGDVIAAPVATAAIVAGMVSVHRHDAGLGRAVAGVALGAGSLLLMFVLFLASSGPA